jgi:hypothetical protein
MSGFLLAVGAQLGAEVRTRLRSAGTLVALAFILVGSTLWMPDPHGKAASLSWQVAGDVVHTPAYGSPYVGVATAILAAIFVLLVAFYLVAGSVRRDRETGVGAILAATPLGKGAYLAGKLAANAAYLGLVSALILAVGVGKFFAFGEGPLEPARLLVPWLFVSVPGTLFVAGMAVLFDVTPGLRGRAGLVIWFFASMFLLVALPVLLSGGPDSSRRPFFDPTGLATLTSLVESTLPSGAHGVSMGLVFTDKPLVRVPWAGIQLPAGVIAARLASLLWAAPPFFLAILLFDRFDPARRLSGRLARRKAHEAPTSTEPAAVSDGARPARLLHLSELPPVSARPGVGAALLAETRLLWKAAPLLCWALLAASAAGGLLPGEAASWAAAVFLVLLVPVISEAGAREALAGAEALVFSQPSVPRSPTLWKTGSLALFLLATSAPLLLRAAWSSAAQLVALVTGLLFVAAFATGAALLTKGGKLFSGLYLALWYAAANKLPAADFCGIFGGGLGPWVRCAYLLTGAAFVGIAMLVERRRGAGRR